jgi:pimeloyl-ACP methyl ester carboxylesterase
MRKTTKKITVNGQSVAIEMRDRASEDVWMFLHGWGGKKEVFQRVTQNLSASTVTVDLPGFGESDDLDQPWSVADYSRTIQALIKQMDLDSVVLVGHSFGGQIAADIAADRPGWLKGLVLVGAAVVRQEEPKLLSAIGSFVSPLFQLPGLKSLRPKLYDLIGADMPPEDENLKETMETVLREDRTEALKKIEVPTKIIWGEDDLAVGVDQAKSINESILQSELVILSGGHHIFIDALDAFVDELTAFHNTLQS